MWKNKLPLLAPGVATCLFLTSEALGQLPMPQPVPTAPPVILGKGHPQVPLASTEGMAGVAPAPCPSNLDKRYGIYRDWRDPCATVTPGALPMPNGWFLANWHSRMRAGAVADRFVIYGHEWYQGGLLLGPYGMRHLEAIAANLPSAPYPVVIEPVGPPEVVAARRSTIVALLTQKGVPDADQRVIVGFGKAEGLRYNDMPIMRQGQGGRGQMGIGGIGGGLGGIGGGIGGVGGGFGGMGGGFRGY